MTLDDLELLQMQIVTEFGENSHFGRQQRLNE